MHGSSDAFLLRSLQRVLFAQKSLVLGNRKLLVTIFLKYGIFQILSKRTLYHRSMSSKLTIKSMIACLNSLLTVNENLRLVRLNGF